MGRKELIYDCPRCRGTGEGAAGGTCHYPGCVGGTIDDRPPREDLDDWVEDSLFDFSEGRFPIK